MTAALQPAATALAGHAAIAAFIPSIVRDRHALAIVERLSKIATDVQSEPVKRLIDDYRDERPVA